ncbi:RidA family protein [Sphingopyxis sp. MWB1]|uniref:RidA family protein n=1 Tax=Sphingopyxis sp. MWB1 TaxID=1537715 RepID=UPI0009DEC114|nr:RidA family protein [Sphingopyxis sp. MWB1]
MDRVMGAASIALLVGLTGGAASATQPGDNRSKQTLMAEHPEARAFQERLGYSDAVIAGDTIYLSGVVAGPGPGEETLEPGFERAFAQMGATLARAGASWADVVDITSFHTDLPGTMDALIAVKNRHVKAPFPAWTAIGVSTLYAPTALVEIKLVARRAK